MKEAAYVAEATSTELDESTGRWHLLSRLTGAFGLGSFVLVLGPIIAASGQEPGFTGDAARRTALLPIHE